MLNLRARWPSLSPTQKSHIKLTLGVGTILLLALLAYLWVRHGAASLLLTLMFALYVKARLTRLLDAPPPPLPGKPGFIRRLFRRT